MPAYQELEEPTKLRHDIAHRGGKDTEHTPVNLTTGDVEALVSTVSKLAELLQERVDARGADSMDGATAADF